MTLAKHKVAAPRRRPTQTRGYVTVLTGGGTSPLYFFERDGRAWWRYRYKNEDTTACLDE